MLHEMSIQTRFDHIRSPHTIRKIIFNGIIDNLLFLPNKNHLPSDWDWCLNSKFEFEYKCANERNSKKKSRTTYTINVFSGVYSLRANDWYTHRGTARERKKKKKTKLEVRTVQTNWYYLHFSQWLWCMVLRSHLMCSRLRWFFSCKPVNQ